MNHIPAVECSSTNIRYIGAWEVNHYFSWNQHKEQLIWTRTQHCGYSSNSFHSTQRIKIVEIGVCDQWTNHWIPKLFVTQFSICPTVSHLSLDRAFSQICKINSWRTNWWSVLQYFRSERTKRWNFSWKIQHLSYTFCRRANIKIHLKCLFFKNLFAHN